ncbi:MAG: DEAD/DEAH box helicase, partial [Jatrophihabitans sp.]
PAVVATSSLELGIDMGAVDLVVQVESPPSVASGLQRVGRAGHQVGAVSTGVIFPKFRGDLVECAVVAERMRAGAIEAMHYPRNPLDVLAQQIVAIVARRPRTVEDVEELVRRAAPFAALPRSALEAVLDMLAGRYPSDAFAELRPRLVWDRTTDTLTARAGAQRLAVTSGGTIPDRGLFGVFLAGAGDTGAGRRVGELDEEMVYESRVGDVFLLGSSSWRIEDITHDRVLVSPAPGQAGRMPFWKGDAPGRPVELGRALGAFLREVAGAPPARAADRARAAGLDEWGVDNLLAYLADQRAATGHLPDDRTVLVERFRDELGDWRLVVHSPFGAPVNAPWALAIGARLRERYGLEVSAMHSDDGIVLRLPDTDADAPGADLALFDPDEVQALVTAEVGGSALFASRFRECAARSLLLPRRDPRRRTPLWQQRQRANQLLQVAGEFGEFPVVLEAMRECLQDVFDLPGLVTIMADLAARRVRVVEVETAQPSPFARSLLFGYVGMFLYDGDAPLAERRAQALSLDSTLLAELMGTTQLRDLLDPEAVEQIGREVARLTPERHARGTDAVADLLRGVGDLTTAEATARGATAAELASLQEQRRAIRVRIGGQERWLAIEDAGRVRDALGTALPVGVPAAFTAAVRDPLGDLVGRYARTHGPFAAADVAGRFGLGVAVVTATLARLAATGQVVTGEFSPAGAQALVPGPHPAGPQWCDAQVLRSIRRRSLATLRREVEPVPATALARLLPQWQAVGTERAGGPRGADALLRAVEQLCAVPVPASALETLVLPSRVPGYTPAMLDELTLSGEVVWAGAGALGIRRDGVAPDGWLVLAPAEIAPLALAPVTPVDGEIAAAVLEALGQGQAMFFRALAQRCGTPADDAMVAAVWELVWAGALTNDTLAPVRALLAPGRRSTHRRPPRPPRARYGRYSGLVAPGTGGAPASLGAVGGSGQAGPAPYAMAGRWSATATRDLDTTRRALAATDLLLDRHGVITRGAVAAEQVPGGFAAVYAVLKAAEESGRVRRGYFVEGLGGAQFAVPGAVDRLRACAREDRPPEPSLVLAATDPANPYGAALPWPREREQGHQPARKAGALVVLVDGALALYVERGGRTLLSFTDRPALLQPAADALALAVRDGALGKLAVERADGVPVTGSALASALCEAGFRPSPRGLRLRG